MAVWVFCNIKGGVGKTSLSINVAASLKGRVLLIYADPQQSAVQWADAAPEDKSLPFGVVAYSGEKLHREIQRMRDQYDYIIVDCPPSGMVSGPVVRSALAVADLAVVPVAPSPLDIRQTVSMVAVIQEISSMRPDDPLQARLVINRTRAGTTLGEEIKDALKGLDILVCRTAIAEREAHKHAALDGVTVQRITTKGGKAAAKDITKLTRELLRV